MVSERNREAGRQTWAVRGMFLIKKKKKRRNSGRLPKISYTRAEF